MLDNKRPIDITLIIIPYSLVDKFIPLLNQFFLSLVIFLDKILLLFMKTDPKIIYPIGYVFSAKKK